MLTGLHHIGIYTPDMKASVEFYEKLGFEVYYRKDLPNGVLLAFARAGSCVVELIQPVDTQEVRQRSHGYVDHIAMQVEDLEATVEALKAKGIEFDGPAAKNDGLFANGSMNIFFTGPSGEKLELFEEM